MDQTHTPHKIDKWIPWFFVLFFIIIAILDAIFITVAVTSHRGTVTKQHYEKGLDYNKTFEKAETQNQSDVTGLATFEKSILSLTLSRDDGTPITLAHVQARIARPVQEGHDFDLILPHAENGLYRTSLKAPLKGRWIAKITAHWNDAPSSQHNKDEKWTRKYQTTLDILIQ